MDLQLNLTTSNVKQKKIKKPQKTDHGSKSGSSQFNFAKKPSIEGKIIAKRRKVNTTTVEKSSFSFLKNDSKEKSVKISSEHIPKKVDSAPQSIPSKKIDNNTDVGSNYGEFSLNITQGKKKNVPKQTIKTNVDSNTVNKFKHKDKKPFDNNRKEYKGQKNQPDGNTVQEKNKQPTFKQIQALFRNNPEIPKIGQRHVKPVSEKLFSGKNFTDLNIHSFSIANLEKNLQLTQLTVVQQKATPVILNGRDVLVRSQTGSGKTLAYALPIVEALGALRPKLKRHDGIKALVVVPTRELALQTYELFVKLMRPYAWIVPGYLIGGENRKAEKARLRKGFNILIGTPGRICDHLKNTTSLKLDYTRCLILDEADRLLDMGYEKDVSSIVQALETHRAASTYNPLAIMRQNIKSNHVHFDDDGDADQGTEEQTIPIPKIETPIKSEEEVTQYQHELSNVFLSDKRQTVLLSATLTKAVETLAGLTMNNPVFIDSSEDRGTVIADSIIKPNINEGVADKNQSMDSDDENNKEDDDLEIVPQEGDESNDEQMDEDGDDSDSKSGEDDSDDEAANDDSDNEADNSDSDDEADNSDSDNGSDDDDSDEDQQNKKNVSVYKGLKAFGGMKTEVVSKEKSKKTKEKKKSDKKKCDVPTKKDTKPIIEDNDGSGSDSDYDFFAAVKNKPEEKPQTPDTTIITDSGTHSNPFQNAIKNAIAQDEMVIPSSVTQIYIVVPMKLRLVTLSSIIVERCVASGSGKMLIFMATQDMIDYHCEILSRVLTGKSPKKIIPDEKNVKKQKKKKREESEENPEESINTQQEDPDVETSPKKELKNNNIDKNDGEEDYEYNYDGIPLEEYEKKMRAEEAFVDVEFFQLHGSMDQKTRTEVFKTFRKVKSGVLLCTDVAARGLDLPHVDCIVQYTGPISATDYVHRVGRTARAGNVGTAYMFLLPSEVLFVRQLEERRIRLHQEDMEKTLSALNRRKSSGKMLKGRQAAEEAAAASLQQTYEDLVEADKQLFVKSCKAFTSWMRFYSTYPREARAAFDRRALHAGHAARALALRVAPKQVAKSAPREKQEQPNNRLSNQRPEREVDPDKKKKKKPEGIPAGFDVKPTSVKSAKRDRLMMISEFESGLEPSKKKKKK